MKALPMSKTRRFEGLHRDIRENDPEGYGRVAQPYRVTMAKYYDDYVHNKIEGKMIDRFILVYHSSSGRSVDGARAVIVVAARHGLRLNHDELTAWVRQRE
jgi:hypothetical protein